MSAAKNSIKILGNHTDLYPQGYFVYDSKKAGGLTVSPPAGRRATAAVGLPGGRGGLHRLPPVAVHRHVPDGGAAEARRYLPAEHPYDADQIWQRLPQEVQQALLQKRARLYTINAAKIARECQLGNRINTVMQMAFFQLTAIIPPAEATELLRQTIASSYGSKGLTLVERNWQALAATCEALVQVPLQALDPASHQRPPWYRPRPRLRADRHRRHAGGAG